MSSIYIRAVLVWFITIFPDFTLSETSVDNVVEKFEHIVFFKILVFNIYFIFTRYPAGYLAHFYFLVLIALIDFPINHNLD